MHHHLLEGELMRVAVNDLVAGDADYLTDKPVRRDKLLIAACVLVAGDNQMVAEAHDGLALGSVEGVVDGVTGEIVPAMNAGDCAARMVERHPDAVRLVDAIGLAGNPLQGVAVAHPQVVVAGDQEQPVNRADKPFD